MGFDRKTSKIRLVPMDRELPDLPPEATPEMRRWYADFKAALHKNLQAIEEALDVLLKP